MVKAQRQGPANIWSLLRNGELLEQLNDCQIVKRILIHAILVYKQPVVFRKVFSIS
jgi:hypothetical protein